MGMGSGNNSRFGRSSLSEINVTPMVDVMLVLLIIFMVTAPISKQGLEVELPKTSKAGAVKTSKKPLSVVIKKNKAIYLNNKKVRKNSLDKELRQLSKKYTSAHIEAHRLVPYEAVAQALSVIKSSGFESISLLTEEAL